MTRENNVFKLISTLSILILLLSTIEVSKVLAFSSEEHEEVTEKELEKLGFTSSAIREVVKANLDQDNIWDALFNKHPEYHGDRLSGETSLRAFNRLRSFINNI
ncbi:MAG: hypothetical protein QXT26_03340 [Thermoproteota archaeon]